MYDSPKDNFVEWQVCNPVAEREECSATGARPLEDLSGKKIGLFWNGKPGGDLLLDIVEGLLRERFQGLTFEKYALYLGVGENNIKRMARCDAVVGAIGD